VGLKCSPHRISPRKMAQVSRTRVFTLLSVFMLLIQCVSTLQCMLPLPLYFALFTSNVQWAFESEKYKQFHSASLYLQNFCRFPIAEFEVPAIYQSEVGSESAPLSLMQIAIAAYKKGGRIPDGILKVGLAPGAYRSAIYLVLCFQP
jgi:hypothetical protein